MEDMKVEKRLIFGYERLETHCAYRMLSNTKPSSRYEPAEALRFTRIALPPSGSLK